MRVAMLSKALVVGAYQRKCELIAALPAPISETGDGIELTVFVPPAWGNQALERVHTRGYALRAIPIRFNGNFHLHYYPTLARELAALKPDIVHIDEEPYNLATFMAMRACPASSQTLFFTWQNLRRTYPPPFRWMERYVLKHADGAIAGNHEAVEVWRAKGYRRAMPVIPQFGVDETIFLPTLLARKPDMGPGQGNSAPTVTIGYIGRLVPEKGVDLLLRAMIGLPGRARLIVVGAGAERPALAQLSAQLSIGARVEFRDAVPSTRMPQVYAGLDAVVLPSRTHANWKEQFGRVLIEAMACGVPVVGSTCGEIPNVIGDAGLIFREGDASELRARLLDLIEQPGKREELARRGRERVLARFTMQRIAQETAALYAELRAAPDRV